MIKQVEVIDLLCKVKEKYYHPLITPRDHFRTVFWKNEAKWLGDTSFLTMIPHTAALNNTKMYVDSESAFLPMLMKFNNCYEKYNDQVEYTSIHEIEGYDFGGGHFLQILQRAMGFKADNKPSTYFSIDKTKKKDSVLINVEGHHYNHLTEQIIETIQNFVHIYDYKFNFTETWAKRDKPYLKDINYLKVDISNLIQSMSNFEYFIGLDSGLMHLASGLDIKSIIIVDDHLGMKPDMLYLPRSIDSDMMPGIDYLYPQNVHLFVNGENRLVKKFNVSNLIRAISGELYPYWSEDYLNLYEEVK